MEDRTNVSNQGGQGQGSKPRQQGGQGQGNKPGQQGGQGQGNKPGQQGGREGQSGTKPGQQRGGREGAGGGSDKPSTRPTPSGVPNEGRRAEGQHDRLGGGAQERQGGYKGGRQETGGIPNPDDPDDDTSAGSFRGTNSK